ncbi:MAG TPA: nucleoside-diphosphate kinase [Candidatus Sulfomarinibacteraceae bacterium]|nr:nucleoside-diphosphate kinase [Candidatus Sulfomarinibacteraceae bacterium]
MSNRTFTIIKPDSVANGNAGRILARLEAEGFRFLAGRMTRLTEAQARGFYAVHAQRPFYNDLVAYMTSGPVWVMALERDNAVPHLRAVMGATNPAEAEEGTIRKLYGESIERNAIHGSDSNENAAIEIAFFFSTSELV